MSLVLTHFSVLLTVTGKTSPFIQGNNKEEQLQNPMQHLAVRYEALLFPVHFFGAVAYFEVLRTS